MVKPDAHSLQCLIRSFLTVSNTALKNSATRHPRRCLGLEHWTLYSRDTVTFLLYAARYRLFYWTCTSGTHGGGGGVFLLSYFCNAVRKSFQNSWPCVISEYLFNAFINRKKNKKLQEELWRQLPSNASIYMVCLAGTVILRIITIYWSIYTHNFHKFTFYVIKLFWVATFNVKFSHRPSIYNLYIKNDVSCKVWLCLRFISMCISHF